MHHYYFTSICHYIRCTLSNRRERTQNSHHKHCTRFLPSGLQLQKTKALVIISQYAPLRIPEHSPWVSALHGSGTQRGRDSDAEGSYLYQHYKNVHDYNHMIVTLALAGIIKTFTQQQTHEPANCLTDQTALREGTTAYHTTFQQLFVQ